MDCIDGPRSTCIVSPGPGGPVRFTKPRRSIHRPWSHLGLPRETPIISEILLDLQDLQHDLCLPSFRFKRRFSTCTAPTSRPSRFPFSPLQPPPFWEPGLSRCPRRAADARLKIGPVQPFATQQCPQLSQSSVFICLLEKPQPVASREIRRVALPTLPGSATRPPPRIPHGGFAPYSKSGEKKCLTHIGTADNPNRLSSQRQVEKILTFQRILSTGVKNRRRKRA